MKYSRRGLKDYYMSIWDEKDERDNRWKPEIICEQIDMIFDYFESDEGLDALKSHINELKLQKKFPNVDKELREKLVDLLRN